MSDTCCAPKRPFDCCDMPANKHAWDCRYRRILWIVLLINGLMFLTEITSGFYSGSQSLLADALDFFGDSANYGISLWVLNRSAATRAKASLLKGASMGLFGLWVIGSTLYKVFVAEVPHAEVMGTIGCIALVANLLCAGLLYKFRSGDSNRESVWICSRNDAIGNIAVMLAAAGVVATATKWPDLLVAAIMALLALTGARRVIATSLEELKDSHDSTL